MTIRALLMKYEGALQFQINAFGLLFKTGKGWKNISLVLLCPLYKKEIKGTTLIDKDRFKWANQSSKMSDEKRQKLCRSFMTKGLERKEASREEFTAYGQACIEMARGIFQLLRDHEAVLFASVIPVDAVKPERYESEEFLRKDHVFLLERFFFFLEEKQERGIIIMDECEKTEDRKFVRKLHDYFEKSQTGKYRSELIVPTPFFVSSDMTIPIQAADLCIYAINWGFRLPRMDSETRKEVAEEFSDWIGRLQYRGQGCKDGKVYDSFGIVYVPDPYISRRGR